MPGTYKYWINVVDTDGDEDDDDDDDDGGDDNLYCFLRGDPHISLEAAWTLGEKCSMTLDK